MRKATLLALVWVLIAAALPARALEAPLPMDEAFVPAIENAEDGSLTITWRIAEGYYLYRDYLAAADSDGQTLSLKTESGTIKDDPGFGATEVYYDRASASVVNAPPTFRLTYQGCQDGGLCYPPQTRTIDRAAMTISGPSEGLFALPAFSQGQVTKSVDDRLAIASSSNDTAVDRLLANGGLPLLIAGFLGFGLLLAFTPCVFPMYPIVAAMLSRQGGTMTAQRGFMLATSYAIALALAFALFGMAAAWAGRNLQMALQGPWAIGTVAGLFVLLALSNFGLFQIQIPAAIGNRFNTAEGGSLGGAALLGFSSAFLIGPCVTAPLAGALLYIARTGDTVIGTLALFSLGLGKGIPLIVMATIGGRALPRAGAWMETVRHAFGFLFLATAISLAAPLVPERLILLPWALLALAFGVYAGGYKRSQISGAYGVLTRSAALVSLLWGSLLLVGFSLGASDPLAPLGPLKNTIGHARNASVDKADFARIGTTVELSTLLQAAAAQGKPTLVYVTAEWCVTCRTIERSVLTAPDVAAALDGVDLARLDVTALDGDRSTLMRSLEVVGPPTMIFFDSNSREASGTRLVGDITAISLASAARAAKASGQRTHVSTLFHHRTGHQPE